MRSLLASLALGLGLSLAAVFAVQWSFVRLATNEVVEDYVAGELAHDAEELFGALAAPSAGAATLALTHFDPPFLERHSGRYYQILVEGRTQLRSPSLADASLPVPPAQPGQRQVTHVTGPDGKVLLLSASGYRLDGRAVTVAVAGDLALLHARFERLLARYTQVSLLMFVLLVVLQLAIVRIVLAPLARVVADVGRLGSGEIGQLSERVPREVVPLVREVNWLLALLSRRLRSSRDALGNLAHALKAPLTVLTHMAEDDPIPRAQMLEQLALLRRRIDSELRRARVAGGRDAGASLDLPAEIGALAATLRQLHRDRPLSIECRVPPGTRFHGDREDLLDLVGNLVDNACKWARSRVRTTIRRGPQLVLTVEDDGPGCSEEDLQRLARRGVRLDEGTEGHGLGLAIARSIAASYEAQMRFGRSRELGGFEVEVTFPREA